MGIDGMVQALQERVANPPVFADVDPQRALKVLVYQAPELAAAA